MKFLRPIFAWVLPALLSACAVGPEHRAPDAALPVAWTEPSTTRGISADAAWWQAFGDPILDALVRDATAQNFDVSQALDRLAEARANLGAARAGLFPSLDGNASWTRSRGLGSGNANGMLGSSATQGGGAILSTVASANMDASWELDLWGKTRRSVEAYGADMDAAAADLSATRLSVLGDVVKAYIDLRTAQARIVVAKNAVTGYRDTLELTRARYRGGLVPETDVLKAEASLASAEADVPPLRSSAAEARHRLAVLMARPPTELDKDLNAHKPLPRFKSRIAAGIPADLLRRRPDVVRAERQLAAASARIGVAEAKLLPALTLSGSLGASEMRSGGITIGVPGTWSIGPSVSLPIFNAGKLRFEADAAVAQANQAAGAYRAAVLSGLEDVENGFAAYRADRKKSEVLARAVKRYDEALRLSKELYAKGLTSFLDVLEAQRSLYSNQDALVSAEGQAARDVVTIFKALGGGW